MKTLKEHLVEEGLLDNVKDFFGNVKKEWQLFQRDIEKIKNSPEYKKAKEARNSVFKDIFNNIKDSFEKTKSKYKQRLDYSLIEMISAKLVLMEVWIKDNKIENYKVNCDSTFENPINFRKNMYGDGMTIDVDGYVNLEKFSEKELPWYIKFGKVSNSFDVSNSALTSLKGCPIECDIFYCKNCQNLKSLKGAPSKCREFHCEGCKGKFTEEDVRKVCEVEEIYC